MPLLALLEPQAVVIPPPAIILPEPIIDRVPRRLQRSRKRGAKTPDGAVYVGRPTPWANPFRFERFGHARSVLMYDNWMEGALSDLELERRGFCPAEIDSLHRMRDRLQRSIHKLHRKDLVCWCPTTSSWCHANTLLRHANEDIPRARFFQ